MNNNFKKIASIFFLSEITLFVLGYVPEYLKEFRSSQLHHSGKSAVNWEIIYISLFYRISGSLHMYKLSKLVHFVAAPYFNRKSRRLLLAINVHLRSLPLILRLCQTLIICRYFFLNLFM